MKKYTKYDEEFKKFEGIVGGFLTVIGLVVFILIFVFREWVEKHFLVCFGILCLFNIGCIVFQKIIGWPKAPMSTPPHL